MNSPVTICPHNKRLLKKLEGRKIAVRVRDTRSAARAAADVRALGGDLECVIVEAGLPLDGLDWTENLAGFPVVVMAPSFGTFRDLEPHIRLLQGLDITIQLPAGYPGNIAGLRILSSLGIPCAAVIGTEGQDWEALADLAAYALLGGVPHAPIEPFARMASDGGLSSPINWEFPCFNGSRRFLNVDDTDRPARTKRISPRRPEGPCASCTGWKTCRGRFAAEAGEGKCSAFFEEMADIGLRHRKRAQTGEREVPPAPAPTPTGPKAVETGCELPAMAAGKTRGPLWIDLRGGPGHALMLSGILKQVVEQHPLRRYNLVTRAGLGSILEGHPAIEKKGYPPKGARVLTIVPGNDPRGPEEGEYQTLAASLGLEKPAEEHPWVPWEFEDEPTVTAIIRWKDRNVLISTGRASSREAARPERWESLVAMLGADGIATVQTGDAKDPRIRGTYNILGLLTPRQLISLPRHFQAVVTADPLMVHAARLCRTPCVILADLPGPIPRGYPGDIHLSFNSVSLKTIHRSIVGILKK